MKLVKRTLIFLLGISLVNVFASGPGQVNQRASEVKRKMHRLYISRDKIRPPIRPVRIDRGPVAPLPLAAEINAKLPEIKRLHDHWRLLYAGAALSGRVRQSFRVRSEESLARTKMANDRWFEIPGGINELSGGRHLGGRVRCLAYAHDNDVGHTVLWIGSSGGGLWKSIPGPIGSWKPMSDKLPGSPSVGAFLVHCRDSNRILIGTGDYGRYPGTGLYRTTDGGITWTTIPLEGNPVTFFRILADVSDPRGDTVIACGEDGRNSGGIWRSEDFGATMRRVLVGKVTDLAQDPVTTANWWAAVAGQGIFESTDGGRSFHLIGGNGGTGLTFPVDRMSISVCESAPNYLYVIIDRGGRLGGIFRSADYGYNWTQIESRDEISWGQGWHTCAIGVHPDDPNLLLAGMGGLQRSDNATAESVTWRYGVDGGHADYTNFLFHPPTGRVIIGNDGGCYQYVWSTGAWTGVMNLGLNALQIMAPNGFLSTARGGARLLAGLQDNGMVLIRPAERPPLIHLGGGDGGQVSIGSEPYIYYFSSGVAYHRYQSRESGRWSEINGSLGTEWTPSVVVDPAERGRVFTNTDEYVWQKPTGSGEWAKMNEGHPFPPDFPCKQVDVAPNADRWVIYATAWGKGKLLVIDSTSLARANWEERTPPLPAGSRTNECLVNAEYWASDKAAVFYTTAGSRPSRAFLSEDYGRHWRNVTGDLTTLLPDANYWKLMRHPEDRQRLFLATDVGIYMSVNGGTNWVRFMKGLPEVVNVMDMVIAGRETPPPPTIIGADGIARRGEWPMLGPYRIFIGTYGRGFWFRPLF